MNIANNIDLINYNQTAPKLDNKSKEAAQEFEAFFLTRMMESMFEGVSTDGMFGGGHAEKIYRSMLFNEYGKTMAKSGGVGVADYVMTEMLKVQEQATTGSVEG